MSWMKLDKNNSKEYEVYAICDSEVYTKELDSGHLLGLYYLVSLKSYPEKENIWESALAVQYFRKLFNIFHEKHLEKLTAISPPDDTAPPTANPSVKIFIN